MQQLNERKRVRTMLVQGLVGLALLCLPQQGHALSVTVGTATVNGGDAFTITLNVVDAVDLTSWQFDLTYDPTIVQANVAGATPGALLPSDWLVTSPGIVDNQGGQILGVSAFGSTLSGSGALANIQFTALSPGLSPMIPSNVFLNFSDSSFILTSGSACVNGSPACGGGGAVPEPSSLLLLAIGGLMLWGMQRLNSQRVTIRPR